jgi:hypothetical protein
MQREFGESGPVLFFVKLAQFLLFKCCNALIVLLMAFDFFLFYIHVCLYVSFFFLLETRFLEFVFGIVVPFFSVHVDVLYVCMYVFFKYIYWHAPLH